MCGKTLLTLTRTLARFLNRHSSPDTLNRPAFNEGDWRLMRRAENRKLPTDSSVDAAERDPASAMLVNSTEDQRRNVPGSSAMRSDSPPGYEVNCTWPWVMAISQTVSSGMRTIKRHAPDPRPALSSSTSRTTNEAPRTEFVLNAPLS